MTARQPIVATLAEARLRELVPAVTHRLLRTPATWIFGYDFFVSYARKDASRYAERLFHELESRGYVTCFDRSDLHAGEHLPDALARACARSRCTVLVDTVGARESQYVADEIGRVERKGKKGQLIRVMVPKVLPLGFTAAPEPARTWAHLPRGAQALLDNAIGVDDPVDARGVGEGAVSSGIADQIVKHRRRVRTLRRFGAAALAIVGTLAYVIGTLAWQRSITAEARNLTASAVAVNAELATLYERARALGNQAVAAGAIPLALPSEAEREVQRALRAVLRVIAAAQGPPVQIAEPASDVRRVVLAGDGVVAWRDGDGRLLARRGLKEPAREIAPAGTVVVEGTDPVLDWTAVMDGAGLVAIVARRDRFETWLATESALQPSRCQPHGLAWERAAVSDDFALVAGGDGVGAVDLRSCTVRWRRGIDTLGGPSIERVRIAAFPAGPSVAAVDTTTGLHVLDAASGTSLHVASHTEPLGEWNVSPGHLIAAATDRSAYFALASGPSSSLEDATHQHSRGPILDLVFSPDGDVLVSSTASDIRIWKSAATNQPPGPPRAMQQLSMEWPLADFAFAGTRAGFYAMPPLGGRVGAELQPLQVPDSLEYASVPLSMAEIHAVHAQGTIAAVEGSGSMQLVAVAPAAFWADRVTGGDLPARVDARGVDSASILSGGEIEVRVRAGRPGEEAWRLSSNHPQGGWQPAPAGTEPVAVTTSLPADTGNGCRERGGRRYGVRICPERVRLFRRNGDRAPWTTLADLSCAAASPECRPPAHPVQIRDVALDEQNDQLVALHVAGRRYFTVTYPLSTRGLRNAVASIHDALAR